MGEQWSPQVDPLSTAALAASATVRSPPGPTAANARGITSGISTAIVPKLVPVAKAMTALSTNTSVGSMPAGTVSPSRPTR